MRNRAPILGLLLPLLLALPLLADTPLLVPVPGPTPNSVSNPAIAALGDGYLSAWLEGKTGSYQVRAIRLDAGAHPIDALSFPLDSGLFLVVDLRLAAAGDEVFALWTTASASAARQTHLARVALYLYYVQRRTSRDPQSLALADGEVVNAAMLAY